MHGRLESTEWHILTGPPDCTVVIDERIAFGSEVEGPATP